MSDDKKPEDLTQEELARAKGGYSVWIGGSAKKDGPEASGITLDNGIKKSGNITLDNGIKMNTVFEPNDKN